MNLSDSQNNFDTAWQTVVQSTWRPTWSLIGEPFTCHSNADLREDTLHFTILDFTVYDPV